MSKCEKQGHHIGVFVRTLSAGVTDDPVCGLSGQGVVRHMVIIENLMLYPADIVCEGSISSNPQLIHFVPIRAGISGVSVNAWRGSIKNLGGNSKHVFAHAILVAVIPGAGPETIKTDVGITWPKRNRGKVLSLSIRVDS